MIDFKDFINVIFNFTIVNVKKNTDRMNKQGYNKNMNRIIIECEGP